MSHFTDPFEDQTRQELESPSNVPSVFMFNPLKYEVVTGDRLSEWEELMRERVGLNATMRAGGSASISFCPGLDDCDEI